MLIPFASRTLYSNGMERQLISFVIAHLIELPDRRSKSVCLANSIAESFGIVLSVVVSYIGCFGMDSQGVQWILVFNRLLS